MTRGAARSPSQGNASPYTPVRTAGFCLELAIHTSLLQESLEYRRAISPRRQIARFLLIDHPFHAAEINLRPTLGCLSRPQRFAWQPHFSKHREGRLFEIVLGCGEHQTSDVVEQFP